MVKVTACPGAPVFTLMAKMAAWVDDSWAECQGKGCWAGCRVRRWLGWVSRWTTTGLRGRETARERETITKKEREVETGSIVMEKVAERERALLSSPDGFVVEGKGKRDECRDKEREGFRAQKREGFNRFHRG